MLPFVWTSNQRNKIQILIHVYMKKTFDNDNEVM